MTRFTEQTRMVLAEFLKDIDTELYGQEIKKATGLHPGTAYPILKRLEADGLLKSRWEGFRGDPGYVMRDKGGPPRKYYALTVQGRVMAQQDAVTARADIKRRRAS